EATRASSAATRCSSAACRLSSATMRSSACCFARTSFAISGATTLLSISSIGCCDECSIGAAARFASIARLYAWNSASLLKPMLVRCSSDARARVVAHSLYAPPTLGAHSAHVVLPKIDHHRRCYSRTVGRGRKLDGCLARLLKRDDVAIRNEAGC